MVKLQITALQDECNLPVDDSKLSTMLTLKSEVSGLKFTAFGQPPESIQDRHYQIKLSLLYVLLCAHLS